MRVSPRDRIPISALQHHAYCPRQCALIHLEQTYDENIYTLRGNRLHDRVDEPGPQSREGIREERALPIWSDEHGLIGRADVVAFPADGSPYPVEYKVGKRAPRRADEIQVCAQALCLEEMFGTRVGHAEIYYHGSRRRRHTEINQEIRITTIETIRAVRELLAGTHLPEPVADARCEKCSIKDACMPFALARLNPPEAST